MKPRELAGRVVVITGASSGIGAATAVACGRAGMRVVLAARRADRLATVAGQVTAAGGAARVVPTDVGDEASVHALIDGTVDAWGGSTSSSTTRASAILATVEQTTPAEFERLVRVNYLGAVHGVLAALPHMRRQGAGHLVNVASVVGKRASPFRAAYVASKFALVGFSEALRLELRGSGIDVTCVCPIGTATEFHLAEPNRLACPAAAGPSRAPSTSPGRSCGRSAAPAPRCIRIRRRGSSSWRTTSRPPSSTAFSSGSARALAR